MIAKASIKCKDCNADMEELFEENMAVLVRGYFVAREGKMVSLYICPKCGRVAADNLLRRFESETQTMPLVGKPAMVAAKELL